ncbi:hypothetical protein [Lacrimispora indolis]|uniref:hypothetical protein n=1 Tax=Lacrimispora indolis TaxID=69825 RepID=UPI0035615797
MSRAEFIEKLEYLLQDLSQEDREDGIAFYRDYLDETGAGAGSTAGIRKPGTDRLHHPEQFTSGSGRRRHF